MNKFEKFKQKLQKRQETLASDIEELCHSKTEQLLAIHKSYGFIGSDILTIAKEHNFQNFLISRADNLKKIIQLIPSEFADIKNETNEKFFPDKKNDYEKYLNFMYHQLFLNAVFICDSFLYQVLLIVFKANPEKWNNKQVLSKDQVADIKKRTSTLGQKKLQEYKFTNLEKFFADSKSFKEFFLKNSVTIEEFIDNRIEDLVKEIKSHEYFPKIEEHLKLDKGCLDLEYWQFREMLLRRNAGVHRGWKGQYQYNKDLSKIPEDSRKLLNFTEINSDFVGFDIEYFNESFCFMFRLINKIKNLFLGIDLDLAVSIYETLRAEVERLDQCKRVCLGDRGIRTDFNKSCLPDVFVIGIKDDDEKKKKEAEYAQVDSPEYQMLLAVEIVSPGKSRDYLEMKKDKYAEDGTQEYWIVDPQKNKVSVLVLSNGDHQASEFEDDIPIVSKVFPKLNLTAKAVMAAKKCNPIPEKTTS